MTTNEKGSLEKNEGAIKNDLPGSGRSAPFITPHRTKSDRLGYEDILLSRRTLDSVKIAKVTVENYYNNLATQYQDRQNRYVCCFDVQILPLLKFIFLFQLFKIRPQMPFYVFEAGIWSMYLK